MSWIFLIQRNPRCEKPTPAICLLIFTEISPAAIQVISCGFLETTTLSGSLIPQTVLHHLNTDRNYEITHLDYFQTSADAVMAYQKAPREEINVKRLETRKRNQLLKEDTAESTDKTEEQPQENPAVETKDISPHTAIPHSIPKSIPEISCS